MYTALAKHAGWSLQMKVKGDLWIDDHHTAEVCIHLFRHGGVVPHVLPLMVTKG
jgi:imidazoleglycerol phosphate dehydratase HisB